MVNQVTVNQAGLAQRGPRGNAILSTPRTKQNNGTSRESCLRT